LDEDTDKESISQTESHSVELSENDLADVDLDKDYVNVDTLMDELDDTEDEVIPEDLDIDVGLGEFDELTETRGSVDVDQDSGGYGSKLDIIRTYIDMDDEESALAAIKDVMNGDNDEAKAEAQELLKELGKE
jgi:pilus assembly protein FimV